MPARVDELACKLIEQHGSRAVHIAVERLNQSIDERDYPARDFWAQVVHAIHEYERSVDRPQRRGLLASRAPSWSRRNADCVSWIALPPHRSTFSAYVHQTD